MSLLLPLSLTLTTYFSIFILLCSFILPRHALNVQTQLSQTLTQVYKFKYDISKTILKIFLLFSSTTLELNQILLHAQ